MFKNQRKCNKQKKMNVFEVEYGIYFHCQNIKNLVSLLKKNSYSTSKH